MRSPDILKNEAIKLRLRGESYKEIGEKLTVPKSTLSYWLKGVKLKPEHLKRLYTKQIDILSRGPKSQKERRAKVVNQLIENSANEIKLPIDDEIIKFFGVGLYWAEGTKSKMMQITNSDPYFILFMVKWLDDIFNVKPSSLKATLNIYMQQDESKVKMFWSSLTGIPLKNFGKSYLKPKNKGFKRNNLYYGTLRIYVPKSTDIKYKMLGWPQALLETYKPTVESLQQRWIILRKTARPVNLETINSPR